MQPGPYRSVAKAGRSPAGARAVTSHTASLVGSDAVFEDVCDQFGVIAVESINDRAYVLERGQFVMQGTPEELNRESEQLKRAYIGL